MTTGLRATSGTLLYCCVSATIELEILRDFDISYNIVFCFAADTGLFTTLALKHLETVVKAFYSTIAAKTCSKANNW